jgi:hypothetical protein
MDQFPPRMGCPANALIVISYTQNRAAFEGAALATVMPQPLYRPLIPSVDPTCLRTDNTFTGEPLGMPWVPCGEIWGGVDDLEIRRYMEVCRRDF